MPYFCFSKEGKLSGGWRHSSIAWQSKPGASRWGCSVIMNVPITLQAAQLLLDTARDWLARHGMKAMRGPWSFVSQEWGAVVEGYTPSPIVMAPYNPPYYNDQLTAYGLTKAKDLLVYFIDARDGYQIPERILTLTDKVAERYKVHVRQLDMKNFNHEVETIIALSNLSLVDNWGYSPVTEAEVRAMAHDLKPIIHPKAVLFAEDEHGRPIGFAIAIPDVNQILKGMHGSLLPIWLAQDAVEAATPHPVPHVRTGGDPRVSRNGHRQPDLPRPV